MFTYWICNLDLDGHGRVALICVEMRKGPVSRAIWRTRPTWESYMGIEIRLCLQFVKRRLSEIHGVRTKISLANSSSFR